MPNEGYARPELLVDAAWVDAHKNDSNVVIVDCEVDAAYARGHIP
ncbi:MAG: rhodanese-like domain-containing protein, partial [Chloroflexota bacterium]|nr:rhodanese-like domain-containing protein [Chloroflexota bacterium]